MSSIDRATESFVKAIKSSEEYLAYRAGLEKILGQPGLKERIDEFRERNFRMQAEQDIDFERLDRFEKEYENFRQEPLVADFLAAELAFCKMMQEATDEIIREIDFQ